MDFEEFETEMKKKKKKKNRNKCISWDLGMFFQ